MTESKLNPFDAELLVMIGDIEKPTGGRGKTRPLRNHG